MTTSTVMDASGMVKPMCNETTGTLTLNGMLCDPLIRMVMQSDGVTEDDMSALLSRVKATLAARQGQEQARRSGQA